jgi:hypothetical protein
MDEWAIVRTRNLQGGAADMAEHHASATAINSRALQIYSSTLLPLGEEMDITIRLQGQSDFHALKGVARSMIQSDDQRGYVVDVDIVADAAATLWRRLFH